MFGSRQKKWAAVPMAAPPSLPPTRLSAWEPEALAHRHAQRGGRKTGGSIFDGAAGRLDLAVDAGNRGQLTGIGRGRKKRRRRTRRNGPGISCIFRRCDCREPPLRLVRRQRQRFARRSQLGGGTRRFRFEPGVLFFEPLLFGLDANQYLMVSLEAADHLVEIFVARSAAGVLRARGGKTEAGKAGGRSAGEKFRTQLHATPRAGTNQRT
jgi:hypothetical protein